MEGEDLVARVEQAVDEILRPCAEALSRTQTSNEAAPPAPIVLAGQLHQLVNGKTAVERGLRELVDRKSLKELALQTQRGEERAYAKVADIKAVTECAKKAHKSEEGTNCQWAFDAYADTLVHANSADSMTVPEATRMLNTSRSRPEGAEAGEAHIAALQKSELLARSGERGNEVRLRVTYPGLGKIVSGLEEGRKEMRTKLRRQEHKQMHIGRLSKTKMRRSRLGRWFHIYDSISTGDAMLLHFPLGNVIRSRR